jgi:hypothetical protein
MSTSKKQADVSERRPGTGTAPAGAGTGTCPAPGLLSFRRIVDIPFDACLAALQSWRLQGRDGELRVGPSRLRGPIEHDHGSGTCRVKVRLARGPLRPLLRMRLNVDRWSCSLPCTALELIPCGRVLATARYFRAGHLLLDSLTRSLQLEWQVQTLDLPAAQPSDPVQAPQGSPGPSQPAKPHR